MYSRRYYFVLMAVVLAAVISSAGCTGTTPASPGESITAIPSQDVITASIPDMTGVWTGTQVGHSKLIGFRDSGSQLWNVTEQNGQVFTGYKVYTSPDGIEHNENFSGAIAYDGKTIYISDHYESMIFGDLLGPDEIELILLNDGDGAKTLVFDLVRE